MSFELLSGGPFLRKRKRECFCVLLALLLTVTGFVILSSASLSFLRSKNYALKQLAWWGLALGAFGLTALIPTEKLRKSLPFWVWLSFGLLLAVLIPGLGTKVNGSRRWIHCFLHIQVSELAKIALILWLADYIGKNAEWMDSFWKGFFKPILFCSVWAGLVLVEPDYGTAVLLLAVAATLLFLGGAKIRHLLSSVAGFLLLFALLVWRNPPRLKRILSFLDLEGNRSDGSYQLWQAILAFVSGGPWGRGIGHGRQQLTYLPEAHTDFIYAVLVEELGCIGGMLIIGLFSLLFLSVLSGLRRQESIFARILGYGALFLIIYQSILNMGVVTACFPTKGIPLPFISYGGSNLITVYVLLGIMTHALRPEGSSSEGDPADPSSAGRSLDF